MEPLSLMGLGLGVAGSIAGGLLGSKAADLQRQAGMEQLRRKELSETQTLGAGAAAAGASGFSTDTSGGGNAGQSSMALHLAAMSNEFRKENAFAYSQVQEGADLSQLSSTLGAASGIGSSLFSFGKANNFWMPKPTVT